MKRLVLILVAACVLQACNERHGYTIRGELADADGLEIVLKKVTTDSEPVDINSGVVKKGKFVLKGKVEFPEYCLLYVGDNGPLQFFVENTEINIVLELENLLESVVTGSNETDLLMAFFSVMSEFGERENQIREEYMALMFSEEMDDDKQNEIIARMQILEQLQYESMRQIADENPNSIFTAILLNNMLPQLKEGELAQYVSHFDELNRRSPWVKILNENVENELRLAIGQPFVDIKMNAPNGTEISLSDYAGKGKYLLIDFWAGWCQPCRIANPEIVRLYDKYKEKGFEIVGVSLDRDREQWLQAIEDDVLTWPQMSDLAFWQSEAVKLYSITSIPHAVLLDKQGNIIGRGLQVDELEGKLAELLD